MATFEYGLMKASEAEERAQERGENGFNVFSALKLGEKENAHSDFIAYLLNLKGEHNQSVFLMEFLEKLKKEKIDENFFANLDLESVERESATRNISKNRRVDIKLSFNDNKFIIIENKITAPDQDLQIKDYISDILKKDKEKTISPQNILFIYLHPTDEEPSDESLGDWNIKDSEICDKNGKMQSYYFKMDYYWVREWLQICVYKLYKEQRECGKSGFGKIIFGVEQYIELLQNEPNILDEYQESNAVLEFVMRKDGYQKQALQIMQDEKHELHEMVASSWSEISGEILENFYNKIIEKFESKAVKIKNDKGKDEIWIAERTERDISTQGGHIYFFNEKDYYKKPLCCLSIGLYFNGKDLIKPYFMIFWIYSGADDKMTKKYRQATKYWEDNFFPPLDKKGRVLGNKGYYYKYILEKESEKGQEGQERFAFLNWVFKQDSVDKAVDEFIKLFRDFVNLEPIKNTIRQVDKYIIDNRL